MLEIKGYFIVNKNKVWGSNIQYNVLVTPASLIFIKNGGQFAEMSGAAITGAVLGGAIGGLVGGAIDKKRQQSNAAKNEDKINQLKEMSEDDIIQLSKDNFKVDFALIESLSLKKSSATIGYGPRCGILNITQAGQKPEQYDISKKSSFSDCAVLLRQMLPDKLQLVD